jgi:hypothetical protein
MVIKLILLIVVMICGLCAVYCGIKALKISNHKGINQLRNKKYGYGKTWSDE